MQRLRPAYLVAGVWLLTSASACGPGVATPMPEPPAAAFDLNGVNKGVMPADYPETKQSTHNVFAQAGTVPAGAVVRVTNLDRTDVVAATNARADGSFEVAVDVNDGQELRFEWVQGSTRSAPADALFVEPDPAAIGFDIQPSARFDCLKLTPGFALDFGKATQATLLLENRCSDPLTLGNARTRLNLADFALPATLPPNVPVGESVSIDVDFTRGAVGLREDILFIDVTRAGTTIRYPITLRAD